MTTYITRTHEEGSHRLLVRSRIRWTQLSRSGHSSFSLRTRPLITDHLNRALKYILSRYNCSFVRLQSRDLCAWNARGCRRTMNSEIVSGSAETWEYCWGRAFNKVRVLLMQKKQSKIIVETKHFTEYKRIVNAIM